MYQMLPESTKAVIVAGGSDAFNGNYIFNSSNSRWEREGYVDIYFYHDGTQWRIKYTTSMTSEPSLPASVTEEAGFWSVPTSEWTGSDGQAQGIANYLIGASYTINF